MKCYSMTDNEIVEALKLCTTQDGSVPCYGCPCWNYDEQECERIDYTATLNLINRQQTEIEALKKVVLDDYATEYDNKIKSEAVKEFADRLKEKSFMTLRNYGLTKDVVEVSTINNLLKEMVGDDNA